MVGCALGVLQNDYIGIFDVIVHPDCRGQGYGERLVRALLGWGKQNLAQAAYLQVMANNAPALRLYNRLGFREKYQYWYRVKQVFSQK
jgi:ribosomal protein S18 acetylase RimI-like enzyme